MPVWNVGFLVIESLVIWTILCFFQKYLLRLLLFYKGWMYEGKGLVNREEEIEERGGRRGKERRG